MTLREPAYAKVNLSLDVVGRRADGYHLLSMVCQTVSLCDTLTFVRKPGAPLSVRVEQAPEIPSGPENLVYRAAERFFAAAGEDDRGVEITIEKHIPAQAGLGGGSADAAAALRGLCRLYGRRLSKETLDSIALAVGADVPFCLCGGTALAEGIGERLTPLKALPRCLFVVVKPPFGVSTKEAYQKIDAAPAAAQPHTPGVLRALQSGSLPALGAQLGNRFSEALSLPQVEALCRRLREAGALGACMTGSGSAVFGLFSPDDAERARAAAEVFSAKGCRAFVCTPVERLSF